MGKRWRIRILVILFVFMGVAFLQSTAWFREQIAKHYIKHKEYSKAISIYKRIFRKESLRQEINSNLIDLIRTHLPALSDRVARYLTYGTQDAEDNKRLGLILLSLGMEQSAIRQFQKFIELRPDDFVGHYRLALIYQRQKRKVQAINEYKNIIELSNKGEKYNSELTNSVVSDAYYQLAKNSEEKGALDEAIKNYEKSLGSNRDGNIDAYYQLIKLYEKEKRTEDIKKLKNELMDLKLKNEVNYKFNDELTLVSYSYNELEFEMFHQFDMTLSWDVKQSSKNDDPSFMQTIVDKNPSSTLYRIGNRWFEIRKMTNLVPDPGFEMNSLGENFAIGWDEDLYTPMPAGSFKIVQDEESGNKKNQMLMLDNTLVRRVGRIAGTIRTYPEKYYLHAGRIRGEHSSGRIASVWVGGSEVINHFVNIGELTSQWQTCVQVVKPPTGSDYCYLWILNFETEKMAFFDDILFTEISLPKKIMPQ